MASADRSMVASMSCSVCAVETYQFEVWPGIHSTPRRCMAALTFQMVNRGFTRPDQLAGAGHDDDGDA